MTLDPFLIIVAVALGLFIFMQFRTAKKRRAEAANLQEKILPGADIMTNYGLYGTVISIDDETNEALIETTPGTVLRIHRQTILKVVEDEIETTEDSDDDGQASEIAAADSIASLEPEFGERVVDAKNDESESIKTKKSAPKRAKSGDE